MKVTRIVRSGDQSTVDPGRCAARYPVATQVELSEGFALENISREDEGEVHLKGQDPQKRGPLFESSEVRIASLDTLKAFLLHGASPQVTQNDIVVLAGERGTWQVVARVNGSKADIRRREGFDTRVVTAVLESLTVVQFAGSPGCSY